MATASRFSSLQREREVQEFLQTWRMAQGSSNCVAASIEGIAAPGTLREQGFTPRASSDKALTGFAQLAVLRLDVRNAMISLIDDSHQTILAEATRGMLLGSIGRKGTGAKEESSAVEDNSELWLGSSTLIRAEAICEHCLSNQCTARDGDGGDDSYTTAGLIVPDCREDNRFKDWPYVVSERGVRFYAGVPIVSRKGHKLGTYAVSDNKPRHGLTVDELRFMEGVAQAVMEHLEWARDRVDRFKGGRIVRGLAGFIEKCSSTRSAGSSVSPEGGAGQPETVAEPPPGEHEATGSKPEPEPKHSGLTQMYHQAAEILRHSTFADGVAIFGATTGDMHNSLRPSGETASSDEEDFARRMSDGGGSSGNSSNSSDSEASQHSKPCQMLAYSLADERQRASIGKGGSALPLSTLERYYSIFPKGKTFNFTDQGRGFSSDDDSASDREPATAAGDGLSDVNKSDNNNDNDSKNSNSNSNDNDDSNCGKTQWRGRRRRNKNRVDHKQLLKKIPGAQIVVFVPLFDYLEDRLAGGIFLWSLAAGRMMNLDADMSHLNAFGSSIMNQVGRINMQRNEVAKTTFIASMSHELRSPLHGILGAVEFLKETANDSYQTSLVESISTCGRTLLDTLNHVLDYSKINRLGITTSRRRGKKAVASRGQARSRNSFESINMTTAVDLATLAEEVVDAVAAGHTFRDMGSDTRKKTKGGPEQAWSAGNRTTKQIAGHDGPVAVLLDICPLSSWVVKTQPGAVRRIIMNLFGNSLKYTSSGHVLVSLRGKLNPDKSRVDVLIRVEDTGIGISDEYQRSSLFVAFSQEDTFQPGTGLGLSIVKQIVDSLDGSLDVRSTRERGTRVDVRLHFPAVPVDSPEAPPESGDPVPTGLKGLRLILVEGKEGRGSKDSIQSRQQRMLNEILAKTCAEWFEMTVVRESDPSTSSSDGDLFLYCEPPSVDDLEASFDRPDNKPSPRTMRPIIIVCLDAEEAGAISRTQCKVLAHLSGIVEVIPQPCGPRKLAKIFEHCFRKVARLKGEQDSVKAGGSPDGGSKESRRATEDEQQNDRKEQEAGGGKGDARNFDGHGQDHIDESEDEDASSKRENPAQPAAQRDGEMPPASPAPLNPGTPSLVVGRTKPQTKASRHKLHVLLVDDNKINLQLLVMFMRKSGFTYEVAENGQEAVDQYERASRTATDVPTDSKWKPPFDFVLMDISMPVMDGLEATRRIRGFEKSHHLRPSAVFALTGLASAEANDEAIAAGVDLFLPKPVRFAELQRLLAVEETPEVDRDNPIDAMMRVRREKSDDAPSGHQNSG
jgi:signal transduction histidine kinase/CheY-like chemotaxis protein